MKRIAAIALTAGTLGAGAAFAVPAFAAGPQLCITYDVSVNGQEQAGQQCLPPSDAPVPSLPGLPVPGVPGS